MADRGSPQGRAGGDAALIAALAAGATREEAAATARVSERTVYRRLGEPAFRARVDEAREEIIAQATARLAALASDAIATLGELLHAPHPPAVRLGAARGVLDLAQRWRVAEEVELRLAALEASATPARR